MSEPSSGPIETQSWPTKLRAHVVEGTSDPRIRGFDVHRDLSKHYTFAEVVLIALAGEAPDAEQGQAFAIAMTFAAPTSVAEAPAHAAALARICGARVSGIFAVGATAAAERARVVLDDHEVIIPRLVTGSLNGLAKQFASRSAQEAEAVQRLRDALGEFCVRVPALGYDLRLETAILSVLMACGLMSRDALEIALAYASMPAICAEALSWQAGDLRAYPMDLPHFAYEKKHDA